MYQTKLIFATFLTLTIGASVGAHAQSTHAVVRIENKSQQSVTYSHKWGHQDTWSKSTLRPGEHSYHTYRYRPGDENRSQKSPPKYITYNNGRDRDDITVILSRGGSPDGRQRARTYVFERSGNKTDLIPGGSRPGRVSEITGIQLPVCASRGASSWTIDKHGVVTSSITYTVGSGSGSKRYSTGLVVEFADRTSYTRNWTKTIGRPGFGTSSGTAHGEDHPAIPLDQLKKIRRVYVKYSTDSSGPNTISEWIHTMKDWVKEGDAIYREVRDTELVKDAVKYYVASGG